jgi:hypothetical protein
MIIAGICIRRYTLTKKELHAIQDELRTAIINQRYKEV